jgi:Ser/Thr protein kinase RdoA (MazF antagonist)
VRFVHRALVESRSRGFRGVPRLATTEDGDTVVVIAGRLYDAQEWTPGQALSPRRSGEAPVPNVAAGVSRGRLGALADALARFHVSTARLRPEQDYETDPFPMRLSELSDAAEGLVEGLHSRVRHRAEGAHRKIASRWLELVPWALQVAREASLRLPSDDGSRVLCHGDLWPAHVHFQGDDFVGFTDFESLAFASPALDLAQLVVHFGGWDTRVAVVRSYERLAPLGEQDLEMLPLEAIADLVGEGLWSLEALYGRSPGEITRAQGFAHASNLRVLLGSLEATCRTTKALREA